MQIWMVDVRQEYVFLYREVVMRKILKCNADFSPKRGNIILGDWMMVDLYFSLINII